MIRLFDTDLTFAIPVFKSAQLTGENLIQIIGENGTVTGFLAINFHEGSFCPLSDTATARAIGNAPLLAFEHTPGGFLVGEAKDVISWVREKLTSDAMVGRPFTRSALANFCGEFGVAEVAEMQALDSLPPHGPSRSYYRLNILARDKIRNLFEEYANGEFPVPQFRIFEEDGVLRIELSSGTDARTAQLMKSCLKNRADELASLISTTGNFSISITDKPPTAAVAGAYKWERRRLLLAARRLLLPRKKGDITPEELVEKAIRKTLAAKPPLPKGNKFFKQVCDNMLQIYTGYHPHRRLRQLQPVQSESGAAAIKPASTKEGWPFQWPAFMSHKMTAQVLHFAGVGMDVGDIAKTLGVPAQAVDVILKRGTSPDGIVLARHGRNKP